MEALAGAATTTGKASAAMAQRVTWTTYRAVAACTLRNDQVGHVYETEWVIVLE